MVWQETFRAAAPKTAGMLREDQINYEMLSVLVGRVCPTNASTDIQMTMYDKSGQNLSLIGVMESDDELFGFHIHFDDENLLTVEVDLVEDEKKDERVVMES